MQRLLGIDIGSYSIKIAELERSFRQFELVGFYEQPLVHVPEQSWEVAVGAALTKLFNEYQLPRDPLYTALPGQQLAFRLMTLPFGDFKKIDNTIEFEMENYVPLALDELLIDYQILHAAKTSSNILISYSKKSDMVKLMTAFSNAEVDPRFVGAEPAEMGQLLKLGMIQPEGAYAILDLGHEKTNVTIFIGSQLFYARTIMLGGRHLTQAVADAMKIPYEEAEKMKTELGQVDGSTEDMDAMTRTISEALKKTLEELTVQLRQTFFSFQESNQEPVQAILLCGGTSRLVGVDQFLSKMLRINVSFADALDAPFNKLSDSSWCRPVINTALALAHRAVMGVGIRDIQFRRGEFAFRGEMREIGSLVRQVVALLSISALFVVGTFVTSYFTLRGKVKNQQAKIAAMAAEVVPDLSPKSRTKTGTVISSLDGKITELRDRKKKMEEEISLSLLDVLKEMSSSLPARTELVLDINDLSLVSKRIRLQGNTDSFEAIDQIKTGLGKSPLFKNISTGNVRKGVKGEVRFDMTVDLGDEEEDSGT